MAPGTGHAQLLAAFLGLTATALLTPVAVAIARHSGALAMPGPRSSHAVPTPVGGGLALVAGWLVALGALAGFGLVVPTALVAGAVPGVLTLSLVGWWDDWKGLRARVRLAVQLAVSLWLLAYLAIAGEGVPLPWWWIVLPALVWLVNLTNFMDGSNGLAASQGAFAGLAAAVIMYAGGAPDLAAAAAALGGACLGFLPWNFPRARVFMGDAGSTALGFGIGALLLLGVLREALPLPSALLLMSVFGVDATLTLLRRVRRGERWYTAHKQHVYQRLIGKGWPHGRVLLLYQAVNGVLIVPIMALGIHYPGLAWPLTGVVGLLLCSGWLIASTRLERARD